MHGMPQQRGDRFLRQPAPPMVTREPVAKFANASRVEVDRGGSEGVVAPLVHDHEMQRVRRGMAVPDDGDVRLGILSAVRKRRTRQPLLHVPVVERAHEGLDVLRLRAAEPQPVCDDVHGSLPAAMLAQNENGRRKGARFAIDDGAPQRVGTGLSPE